MKVFLEVKFLRYLEVFDIDNSEILIQCTNSLFRDKLAPLWKWRIWLQKGLPPDELRLSTYKISLLRSKYELTHFIQSISWYNITYPLDNP